MEHISPKNARRYGIKLKDMTEPVLFGVLEIHDKITGSSALERITSQPTQMIRQIIEAGTSFDDFEQLVRFDFYPNTEASSPEIELATDQFRLSVEQYLLAQNTAIALI